MAKIYLITYREQHTIMVSHGVDEETLCNVCLSQDPLDYYIKTCGARRDENGEFYIETTVK